jgi:Cupin domain
MKRRMSLMAATAAATALLALASLVSIATASPPSGATPTVLARGTYDAFEVGPGPKGSVDFTAKAGAPMDIIVRQHDYAPGASTGWHTHPGPVFITVTKGQLTFYESDDPDCKPHVVSAGHGYEDTGHGHIGRNETEQPAQDISVIIAPVGGAFRGELPAPGPHCKF